MANGIKGAARSVEDSLNISLTSGSTKHRGQVLRSLQEELRSNGQLYTKHIESTSLLIDPQIMTQTNFMADSRPYSQPTLDIMTGLRGRLFEPASSLHSATKSWVLEPLL
jgi:hypothetical protein